VPEKSNNNVFIALDLDRTLFNTATYADTYIDLVAQSNPDLADRTRKAQIAAESVGESFYVRRYISQNASDELVHNLDDKIVAACEGTDLLNPGASELLAYLDQRGYNYGILTYGERTSQELKLRAGHLESIPLLVTSNPSKGLLIAGWRDQDSDEFMVPGELTGLGRAALFSGVRLVDDRARSFVGLPDHNFVRGYHYQPTSTMITDLSDILPKNVKTIQALSEVGDSE